MKKRDFTQFSGFLILLLMLLPWVNTQAQNAADLRFNEILVHNESNYVDDFGNHSPWIEIFNTAYNSVNIGGCYLTDDISNPTKYWIPTGSPSTLIAPRSYIVFWADNKPTHGIFHLNFNIENAKVIALFDASGRTMIDKVEIVQPQKTDVSYGIANISSTEWSFLNHSTPGSDNDYSKKVLAGENFTKMDPFGIGMTIIAMFVVFSALATLYVIYFSLGRYFVRKSSVKRKQKEVGAVEKIKLADEVISGELNAAVAMTLYLYQTEMHDYENTVLTIQKVSRNYSPWNSKIYTIRKMPK
jgi:hypothetical protein